LQEQKDLLHGFLVRHFRTAQLLYQNARAERAALCSEDILLLQDLAEQRELLLDQLNSLEQSGEQILEDLSAQVELRQAGKPGAGLETVFLKLDPEKADVVRRLHEGSQVLMEQTRSLARGNQTLAARLLSQANDMQALYVPSRASLPALFAALVAARDVLAPQEGASAPASKSEVQAALNYLNHCLELPQPPAWPVSERAYAVIPDQAVAQRDENLAEVIAGLYHQETAYKAVLRGCNRILISA
jgi:hypothetical protein